MRVAVVGAGLAGLVAACELAERGCQVTLFERRPWAGGKAYAFRDRETGEWVDNGQHVFLTCTSAYTAWLRRLGTLSLTHRQSRLRLRVYDGAGRRADLCTAPLPSPLHLAPALLSYRHLGAFDKLRVARAMHRAARVTEAERLALDGITFAAWLHRTGQREPLIRGFWDMFIVPTLNCRSDEASAAAALFVVREGLLRSSRSSAIGLPRVALSQLHVEPALRRIERHGGEVRLGCGVAQFAVRAGQVEALVLASGERATFDAYVSALPHRQLLEALPAEARRAPPFAAISQLATAPIVNLHLWFDRPVAPFDFATVLGEEPLWIFNRTRIADADRRAGEHLVISLSAAQAWMPLTKQQVQARVLSQIAAALPATRRAAVRRALLLKEPEATFVPAPGTAACRPGPETPLTHLFLAGAWTATGWPATMESAVRSGLAAAEAVLALRAEGAPLLRFPLAHAARAAT